MARPIRRAIYPGTFDPVTFGHLDILKRASALFDEVTIAVAADSTKAPLFSVEERLALLRKAVAGCHFGCPVKVESFKGLLVNFARKKKASTLVRGLRAISDFEYEFQMALMNRHQSADVETVFLMPDERYVYLSSSMVRVVDRLDGNLKAFLPPVVLAALKAKKRA